MIGSDATVTLNKMKIDTLPLDSATWWPLMTLVRAVSFYWNGQKPDWNELNSRTVSMRLWVYPEQRERVWTISWGSSAF